MATIDNLTLEINANSDKATKAVIQLAQGMKALKDGLPTENKLTGATNGFRVLREELSKISLSAKSLDKIKSIGNIAKNMSALNNIPTGGKLEGTAKGLQVLTGEINKLSLSSKNFEKIKSIGDIAKNLSKLKENTLTEKRLQGTADGINAVSVAINNLSYEGINKVERLSSALAKMPKYSATRSAMKTASGGTSIFSKFKEIFSTKPAVSGTTEETGKTGEGEMNKLSDSLSKVIGLFSLFKTVGTKIQPVIGIITTALGFMGKAFKAVLTPIRNLIKSIQHFVKSLARIAFYRFIRSILKAISAGLKEGVNNLALYSKAMEELDTHSANHVMSRYASEFLYFKNAIATAVMPVLRAMIPLIETVINKCIDFINVIAQIGSAFFGTTFTKAKYFWVDYADSLDNANGRAKALHHQLAGFDELNNLTAPSGGSGANDLLDPSQMFEEADIASSIYEKVNKIKELFEKLKKLALDIWDIIKPIKDKIVEIFNWFVKLWDRVYPNLQKVWELVKKIWDKLAKPLTEGFIKGFIEGLFGDPDSEGADRVIEFIGKLTDKIGEASDKLSGYLDKIDTDKVKKFGEIIGEILGNLAFYSAYLPIPLAIFGQPKFHEDIDKLLDKLDKFKEKTNKLTEDIKESAKTLKSALPEALGYYVGFYVGSIGASIQWIEENVLPKLEKIAWFILTFPLRIAEVGEKIPSLIQEAFQKAYDKIVEWGNNVKNWVKDELPNLINDIVDWFKKLPEALETIGKNMIIGLWNGGASMGTWLYDKFGGMFGSAFNGVKEAFEGFKKGAIEGYNAVPRYATGGYVSQGDLFIANERGAEMVGSIGNQTAVANNDQITQAIATATYNAMSKALSENNGNVTVVVEGDGDQMYKIWQKKNKEYGRRTGLAY